MPRRLLHVEHSHLSYQTWSHRLLDLTKKVWIQTTSYYALGIWYNMIFVVRVTFEALTHLKNDSHAFEIWHRCIVNSRRKFRKIICELYQSSFSRLIFGNRMTVSIFMMICVNICQEVRFSIIWWYMHASLYVYISIKMAILRCYWTVSNKYIYIYIKRQLKI